MIQKEKNRLGVFKAHSKLSPTMKSQKDKEYLAVGFMCRMICATMSDNLGKSQQKPSPKV